MMNEYYLDYYKELCPHQENWVYEQLAEAREKLDWELIDQAAQFHKEIAQRQDVVRANREMDLRERDQLRAELAALREESEEQARLLGASAERECDLRGKVDRLQRELATEREKMRVLKLDKDRLDWWNGESYYQFGKSHKCMNPGWWWSCGFDQIQGKSGIKNIRDAIDSAMAHSKSGRNKYNVCDRIEKSSTENKP